MRPDGLAPTVAPEAAGIYVHVPFCRKKCVYCDFHSVENEEERIDDYVDAVVKELTGQAGALRGRPVVSLFFGGGTPSLLEGEQVARIVATVKQEFRFARNGEITLEMNPESVTPQKALAWRLAGVTRASLGIQSLADGDLATLGRIHTAAQGRQAFEALKGARFPHRSVDLMFALPEQTEREWADTLREVLDWGPDHLSAYELTVEPHTPLFGMVERGEVIVNGAGERMFDATEAILRAHSFVHYEISNYARPGAACLHNLGYWELRDYLGVGPGAHSLVNGVRWANVKSLTSWLGRVGESGAAVAETERVTAGMRRTERLMMGLRLAEGIPFTADLKGPGIDGALEDGWLEIVGDRLRTTPRGWRLLNDLLARIV
ncbi:MAG: radical SAM family heme chaperone HemW [Nitrospinae bacterium]|nr:radical SAM family heme chaperone HemW [Nitrospinota bacterium]